MVLECSLEHKAHIPSPDLGGGKCSTTWWLQWVSVGCKGLGMLRGKLLGHLSVFCPAGAEWVLGLGAPQGQLTLVAALREQQRVQEMRFSSLLTKEFGASCF